MLPNRYDFHEAEPRLARLWAELTSMRLIPLALAPFLLSIRPHQPSPVNCISAIVILIRRRMSLHATTGCAAITSSILWVSMTTVCRRNALLKKLFSVRRTRWSVKLSSMHCLELTGQTEDRFEALWRRLSLSVDWRYRYSTISSEAQRTSQWSFIQLYQGGRAYTQLAPTLWCPECQTAIAQAEVNDMLIADALLNTGVSPAGWEHFADCHDAPGTVTCLCCHFCSSHMMRVIRI